MGQMAIKQTFSFGLLVLGKLTCQDLRSSLHDLYTINYENLVKQIKFESLLCNESKRLAQDIIEVKAKYLFIVSLYSVQIDDYKRVRREFEGFNRYRFILLFSNSFKMIMNNHWVCSSSSNLFYHIFTV